jgi:hypothetical protein
MCRCRVINVGIDEKDAVEATSTCDILMSGDAVSLAGEGATYT